MSPDRLTHRGYPRRPDGHDRVRPRPSRRRGQLDGRVDGPGRRRGPPGRARRVHERRPRRGARRPRRRRDARRPTPAGDRGVGGGARRRPRRLARLPRLGDDRLGRRTTTGVVLAGRRRRGRRAAGRDPARGARRRRRAVRLARRLRPPRPHPGPPRRPPRGRPGRHAAALRGHVEPRPADAGWIGRRPAKPTRTSTPTARPTTATRSARRRPSSTSPSTSRRTSRSSAGALAAHASQVTDIGMFLAMPEERLRRRLRHRVVHRAGRRPACATAGCSTTGRLMALVHLVRHGRGRRRLGHRPRPGPRRASGATAGRRARRPLGAARGRRSAADRHQPAAALPGDGRAARRALGRRRRWSSRGRPRSRRRRGVPMGERVAVAARGDGRHVGATSATLRRLPRRRRRATSPRSTPTPSSCRTSSPSTPSSAPASATTGS